MNVRVLAAREFADIATGTPFLRWGVGQTAVARAWAGGGAVAVERYRRPYGASLTVVGNPADAVRLAAHLVPHVEAGSVTLPRAAAVPPGAPWRSEGVDWEWMWTDSDPPRVPGEDRVAELNADPGELGAFLAEHSPRHSAEPGDPLARAWLGARATDGGLLACVALYEAVPRVDLMASVAVATAARGRGLGLAVTAAATRRMLRERPPVATVDLYSDNGVARVLYRRLGYRLDQEFTSYALSG